MQIVLSLVRQAACAWPYLRDTRREDLVQFFRSIMDSNERSSCCKHLRERFGVYFLETSTGCEECVETVNL